MLQISAHPEAPQRLNEFGQLAQALKEMEHEIPVHEIQFDLDFIRVFKFLDELLDGKVKTERIEDAICRGCEGRLPGRTAVLQLRLGQITSCPELLSSLRMDDLVSKARALWNRDALRMLMSFYRATNPEDSRVA